VALATRRAADAAGVVSWAAQGDGASPREPRFLLYSVTKIVLAALVCRLAEGGSFDLEAPLGRWFPEIPEAPRIRLRQVLGHRAGLPDYGPMPEYHAAVAAHPESPWTRETFLGRTVRRGLDRPPGREFAYSNPGYMLLRELVEREAGEPWADAVQRLVAGPLGLRSWSVPGRIEDLADLAPARSRALDPDGGSADVRDRYHPGWVSHGTLAGNASDTARFLDALAGGEVVSAASLAAMTELLPVPRAQVPREGVQWVTPSYGLGLMGDPDSPLGPVWGHNGGGPGYTASAFHAAASGVSVCALCASEAPPLAEVLAFAALRAVSAPDRPRVPDHTLR
jgi:D-alanyl-D-alanine carboxypeptidase